MSELVITTNNVPRDLIQAWELTKAEQKEFDYLDWDRLELGEDSAEFFRYKGQLYDLHEFERVSDASLDFAGWHGYASDSFFSGILIKWPVDEFSPTGPDGDVNYDYERIIVGWYYVKG